MNKMFNLINELKSNNIITNKELKYVHGSYIGRVLNGFEEGKGIFYFNNGDGYEGNFKNGKFEGGILERPKPMELWSNVGSFFELCQSDQEHNLERCWNEGGANYTDDGAELDLFRSAIGAKYL